MSPGAGEERLRLFAALDLPESTREALAAWRDRELGGHEGLRPVDAQALHVTLAFLGSRDRAEVEPIATAMAAAARGHGPCELSPGALRPVPERRPRVVALGLGDSGGCAAALQGALVAGLEGAGLYEPERRAFWAHVTVARVPRGARVGALDVQPPSPGPFEAEAVTLYRSHLRPGGAEYEALHSVRLGLGGA